MFPLLRLDVVVTREREEGFPFAVVNAMLFLLSPHSPQPMHSVCMSSSSLSRMLRTKILYIVLLRIHTMHHFRIDVNLFALL